MKSTPTAMARKVAPRGLPSCLRCRAPEVGGVSPARVVLRRKSWVMAMPIDANAREVRSQARKVRSTVLRVSLLEGMETIGHVGMFFFLGRGVEGKEGGYSFWGSPSAR